MSAPEEPGAGEHRRGLLRAHHAHRHHRHLGAHGRLHEAAAPEAPQPVAVLVELLGALAPLREDEHELLLVEQQPVHVRRVRRHAADLRDQHREARIALEEVLDGDVQRARLGVLLADRLRDHRGVGRQRAGVVRHEQRPAGGGHVLDALHLGPEPVAVEEVVEGAVHQPLHALRAAPVGQAALGLDAGQVAPQLLLAHGREPGVHGARRAPGRPSRAACGWTRASGDCVRARAAPTLRSRPHALQGRGPRGRLARHGARGRGPLPRSRGAHPQLRRPPRPRPSGWRGIRPGWRPRPSRPTRTRPRPTPAGSRSSRARCS